MGLAGQADPLGAPALAFRRLIRLNPLSHFDIQVINLPSRADRWGFFAGRAVAGLSPLPVSGLSRPPAGLFLLSQG